MLRVQHRRAPPPGPSPSARSPWSPPAGRRARSAPTRSTPRVTSARARTATGAEREPADAAAGTGSRARRADALEVLARGELEVRGRLVDASNATLLAAVTLDGVAAPCVYKPVAGERPLWDFPARTLARREVAAYVLVRGDRAGDVVPPTVLRATARSARAACSGGSAGPGGRRRCRRRRARPSPSPAPGWSTSSPPRRGTARAGCDVLEAEGCDGRAASSWCTPTTPTLRRMAVFDAVANNADRKGGHVLRAAATARVFGVDHGLTFNDDDKLRTVLWGWAGEPLADEAVEVLDAAGGGPDGRRPAAPWPARPARPARRCERDPATASARLLAAGRHPRPAAAAPPSPGPPSEPSRPVAAAPSGPVGAPPVVSLA